MSLPRAFARVPFMHAFISADVSPLIVCAVIVLVSVVGGLVPMSPLEPMLVGLAMLGRPSLMLPVVALAIVTQMASKGALFVGSRKALDILSPRKRRLLDRASARLEGRRWLQIVTVLVSSISSIPPFYLVTITCGALRLPLRDYLVVATIGRTIRFTALVMLPRLFTAADH